MGILSNPNTLLGARITQLVFSLGFIAALGYSNTHKGYWVKLEGPVALGSVSFIFTLLYTLYALWQHFRKSYNAHGKLVGIAFVVLNFIILLMWTGTATLMLRPRELDQSGRSSMADTPPDIPWHVGIAFSFVEIVAFALTTILTGLHLRGGGASTSASYV